MYDSKTSQSPSYSDDWLLGFHNNAQNEMQLITNSLAIWNAEQQKEQQDILEWQDSFRRNGFADFTPPMSAGLNCLMIGGDIDNTQNQQAMSPTGRFYDTTKLPWEEEPEADITSLRIVSSSKSGSNEVSRSGGSLAVSTTLVSLPTGDTTNKEPSHSTKIRPNRQKAAVYDCIVDQGLMGAVVNDETSIQELLLEAAMALREHGIYVLVSRTLSDQTKGLLRKLSIEAGLEWEFELDGISDEVSQVSVARRFCTGKMPVMGKLSRFQP